MPTISEFFGISIRMYYNDHNPPHIHAYYAEYQALISIQTLEVIAGNLPNRVLLMVIEWIINNRQELMYDWELAKSLQPLIKIKPLE